MSEEETHLGDPDTEDWEEHIWNSLDRDEDPWAAIRGMRTLGEGRNDDE